MTPQNSPHATLTQYLRQKTQGVIVPVAQAVHRLGIHPDVITVVGTGVVAIAGVLIGLGYFQVAGVVLLCGLPLDALDGAVARVMKRTSRFGAVLDSTLDRYADGFIFMALSYYFAVQEQLLWLLLTQAALLGTYLVSYIRARGEGVGVLADVGWFTRVERTLVIIGMLLFPFLLEVGIVVLALGTHLTALHRLWFVYRQLLQKGN